MTTASDDAEAIFAAWVEARDTRGDHAGFDSLLAANPSLADELREMHEDLAAFEPLLGNLVPGSIALTSLGLSDDHDEPFDDDELTKRLRLDLPDAQRYSFRKVLGRGGGGVVLKVWDERLRRPLAMKIVLDHAPFDGRSVPRNATLARFVDEARIASQLDHPSIVPVHEIGSDDRGRVFFTMRLVEGEELAAVFAKVAHGDGEWTTTRALGTLDRVCEAVAYAHERGVVHRDLKPSNIMVGRHGDVHVMDWGLARVTRTSASGGDLDTVIGPRSPNAPASPLHTSTGSLLGTPGYMAPEQVRGEVAAIDERTDVFAIGAMLYELLAGHAPFLPPGEPETRQAVLGRAHEGRVRPLPRTTPAELVSICEKAMARDKAARYPSARALESDIAAYLDGRVVEAHAVGAWPEARKWIARNRSLAALLAVLLVGSITVLALVDRSRRLGRDVVTSNYQNSILASLQARDLGQYDLMTERLDSAPPELRGLEWWYLTSHLDQSIEVIDDRGDARWLSTTASGDGLVIHYEDFKASLWDAKAMKQLAYITDSRAGIDFEPTWPAAVTALGDVWSLDNRGLMFEELGYWAEASPRGQYMSTGENGVYEIALSACVLPADPGTGYDWDAGFAPDELTLLTYDDERAVIWDTTTWSLRAEARPPVGSNDFSATMSPNGDWVTLSTKEPRTLSLWRAPFVEDPVLVSRDVNPWHTTFSDDGSYLAALTSDGALHVWYLPTLIRLEHLEQIGVKAISFAPDSMQMLIDHRETATQLVDIMSGGVVTSLAAASVHELAWSPDNRYILGDNGTVWSRTNGMKFPPPSETPLKSAVFAPDLTSLIAIDADDRVSRWTAPYASHLQNAIKEDIAYAVEALQSPCELIAAEEVRTTIWSRWTETPLFDVPGSEPSSSPSGDTFTTHLYETQATYIWDTLTTRARRALPGTIAAALPNDDVALVEIDDMDTSVVERFDAFEIETGERVAALHHLDEVISLSPRPLIERGEHVQFIDAKLEPCSPLISSDHHVRQFGEAAAVTSSVDDEYGNPIRVDEILDLTTGEHTARFENLQSLQPIPGHRAVTVDASGRLAEVDVDTLHVVIAYETSSRPLTAATPSPDGSRLATLDVDGRFAFWDRSSGACLLIEEWDVRGDDIDLVFDPFGEWLVATSHGSVYRRIEFIPRRERHARIADRTRRHDDVIEWLAEHLPDSAALSDVAEAARRLDASNLPRAFTSAVRAEITRRCFAAHAWVTALHAIDSDTAALEAAIENDESRPRYVRDVALSLVTHGLAGHLDESY